jgi:tripartite ATP-independent transporter DctM subunit
LLALPMFVLTGELFNRLNLTDRLIDLARSMVGWLRGGLAHVNILTSMFFAGISGSIFGDIASIGTVLIPSMVRERYGRAFSAAVTASSSIIGAIIPPSTVMIIIGAHLDISVGGLFAAGMLPGIMIGLALMITAFVISSLRGYGEMHRFEGPVGLGLSFIKAAPTLLIPVGLISGILMGVFTPTEGGAAAVVYTLLVGAFIYRNLTLDKVWAALKSTVIVTASALFIVSTAFVFSRIMTFHRIPQELLDLLLAISDERWLIILIVLIFFIVVGTFMDALANMIILGPLLYPVMVGGLGMHELQFGMMLIVGLLLGLLTPPLGICLFMVTPIARTTLGRTTVAVLPFLAAEFLVLLLIAYVPAVTLTIPRWVGFIS